jgi:transposase
MAAQSLLIEFVKSRIKHKLYYCSRPWPDSSWWTTLGAMSEVGAMRKRIAELETQLAERDARIAELETQLAERDARIAELVAQLAERDAYIVQLNGEITALQGRLTDLQARLRRNSTNSSKPPSSDSPKPKRPGKPGTGRSPGGQPGHPPHQRELLPPDQVDHIVQLPAPTQCRGCHQELLGEQQAPYRHQVVEVPPIKPVVTEYQCQAITCAHCGARNQAELPPEVANTVFGERLSALISLLVGEYRLSVRQTQELLSEILGVKISLGGIHDREQEMSQALETPVAEAEEQIRHERVVNMDETSWFEGRIEGGKRRVWLWLAATALISVFKISTSRGGEVARALLGEDFSGFLISDRWGGYNWVDPTQRQLCWSHLTRDFQGFIDRGGEGARLGQALMDERDRMFMWWKQVKDGVLSHRMFKRLMKPVEQRVGALLREAAQCSDQTVARSAAQLIKLECALWTFVHTEGVEPTNNLGERLERHGVLYRKISYGTQSPEGSRFIERILTAVGTLKLQGRNVLGFLTDVIHAYRRGLPPPSLLPLTTGPPP